MTDKSQVARDAENAIENKITKKETISLDRKIAGYFDVYMMSKLQQLIPAILHN